MQTGRCKQCGALILWATSYTSGKAMPLDAAVDERVGNVLVDANGKAHAFKDHAAADGARRLPDSPFAGADTLTSHHWTCRARGGPGQQPRPKTNPEPPAQTRLL